MISAFQSGQQTIKYAGRAEQLAAKEWVMWLQMGAKIICWPGWNAEIMKYTLCLPSLWSAWAIIIYFVWCYDVQMKTAKKMLFPAPDVQTLGLTMGITLWFSLL